MPSKDENITVSMIFPRATVEYLDGLAQESDLSRSQVLRAIIREHQKRNAKKTK